MTETDNTESWNSECTVTETNSPHEQFILYKQLSEVNQLASGSVLSFIKLMSANQNAFTVRKLVPVNLPNLLNRMNYFLIQ